MIRFVFLLLIVIPSAYAQNGYDTIYHPFYDHVQMIEIRPKNAPVKKGFTETAFHIYPHTYILRTDRGETEWLNVAKDQSTDDRSLRSVGYSQTVIHRRPFENTSHHIGFNDMGYNMLYPVHKNWKVGLMDTLGNLKMPVEFDNITWTDSVFIAQRDGKYELYDALFQRIVPGGYDEIIYANWILNHLILIQDEKYGMIRRNGEVLMPLEYEKIRDSEYLRGNYVFKKDGKWGFVEHNFTHYLEPFSPSPNLQRRGDYFVYHENGLWNLIDVNGKAILQTPLQVFDVLSPTRFIIGKYDKGYQKSICDEKGDILTDRIFYDLHKINGQAVLAGYDATIHDASNLQKSTKWLLLDLDGKPRVDKVYEQLLPLDDRWLRSWKKGKLTVIDDAGQERLDFSIDDIYKYTDHIFRLSIDKKFMFIDLQNPEIRSELYELHHMVKGNRIAVMNNQKWGFMDSSFRVVVPLIFDKVEDFRDGVATVQSNGKMAVIDEAGRIIAETGGTHPLLLGDGYTQILSNGKYGIIDRNGKFAIPAVYDEIRSVIKHKDTYFIVAKKGDKYGILDIYNHTAYPFIFEYYAEISVHSGIEQSRQNGFYAYLTIEKRKTIEKYYLNFDPRKDQLIEAINYSNGFKRVSKSGSPNGGAPYGVKNWDGKLVIPCIYTNIDDYRNYTFRIYTPQGCGLIDTAGKILIQPKYKYLYDLGSGTNYIQVGRQTGGWGLYTYQGKMLADTLYGGFDRPVFGLIPFFANPNYRFDPKGGWIHDERKVGIMDSTGKILLEAIYDRYTSDQKKQEVAFVSQAEIVYIDPQGKVLRRESKAQAGISIPVIPPEALTEKELKALRKMEKRQKKKLKNKRSKKYQKVRYL